MIYLDNAATSFPKPPCLLKAMNECIGKYCGNPGRSGHFMSMKTGEEVYKARKSVGNFFNIGDTSRIVFTSNATDALNLAIKGVLVQGDHVITTSMEHNSVLRPLVNLENYGVEVTVLKCCGKGFVKASDVEKAIKKNTRMIVCTHSSNVTGSIMPIKKIGKLAKEYNIIFLVDAAQSAGCIHIDVFDMEIDLLAVPGHKGLLGPLGTGFLYVNDNIKLKHLKEGGTGTLSKELDQPMDFPEGYEAGTINAPGIIGLGASINFVKSIGIEAIRLHEDSMIELLDTNLRNMNNVKVYGPENFKDKTGITLINIDGLGCEEVSDILNSKYGIASRAGFHCAPLAHKTIGTDETGAVRLSVGPYTQKKDIKRAINAIYDISKNK